MQLTHYNNRFKKRKFPIYLISDNVTNSPNIGSLFRIADAFGVEKLMLCGEVNMGRKARKTSRSTEKYVSYEIYDSTLELVKHLKSSGVQMIALEITKTSQAIQTYQFPLFRPIALIVGNENIGVSESVLELMDDTIHIEMFGENSSMNVAQATNIALYELTRQLL